MATTFIVNVQKASKKYALFSDGVCVLEMQFIRIDGEYSLSVQSVDGKQSNIKLSQPEYENAFAHSVSEVLSVIEKSRLSEVTQVVIKVAVPGTYFQQHKLITPDYKAELKKMVDSTPLQVVPLMREIKSISNAFPQAQIHAASDTAFYSTLPAVAREWSVSPELTKSLELYRFGMNGLSVSSATTRVHSVTGRDPEKSIVCHIGETVSVSAVSNGKAVDTSVGFPPASGFAMGSQAGDIDVTSLLKIMRHKNLRPAEAELYLDNSGGLNALAGTSDLHVLLKRISQNDSIAAHALELLVYKIQQAIAAATVPLEGLDALIFTGTAAVRSPELRSEILRKLKHLDILINEERNNTMIGKDGVISERNSPVKVVVLKSDQMSEMNAVINQDKMSGAPKTHTT
jgi:acetate kinase